MSDDSACTSIGRAAGPSNSRIPRQRTAAISPYGSGFLPRRAHRSVRPGGGQSSKHFADARP